MDWIYDFNSGSKSFFKNNCNLFFIPDSFCSTIVLRSTWNYQTAKRELLEQHPAWRLKNRYACLFVKLPHGNKFSRPFAFYESF